MKVVIIGSGNVAAVVGRKIVSSGFEIIQLAGRNAEQLASLSSSLNTIYTTNLLEINNLADIYLIAVSDVAINTVAAQLRLTDKLVVHTAAAVSKEVLAHCSVNYGVLYPLQTLRKEIKTVPIIPILVDGNNDETKKRLISFSRQWADNVGFANDEERLKTHLAAIFVNNFTNHLFTIAQDYCSINSLNFSLLRPIIKETILRLEAHLPSDVQTGPAIRNDLQTISKHREMLEYNPEFLKVYNVLTSSIMSYYNGNKV